MSSCNVLYFFSGWENLSYLAIFVFQMDANATVKKNTIMLERERMRWRKMNMVGCKHE